jgi:Escherichia/Staphylococcus phage prohead protease
MKKIERRAFTFDFRAASDAEKPKMRGHAAVFNSAADLGYFSEIIEPGAFAKTIGADDIRALWNHNPDIVLGRNKANTLTLSEDETGLLVEIDPPDTSWGRDLQVSMKRGDISQMSIGFYTIAARAEIRNGVTFRILTEVQLLDVSPVTYPAYEATDIAVRSAQDILSDLQPPPETPADWEGQLSVYRRRLELAGK